MPPCHGGDRRFESGRARHILQRPPSGGVFSIWASFNSRFETAVRSASSPAGVYSEDECRRALSGRARHFTYACTSNLKKLYNTSQHSIGKELKWALSTPISNPMETPSSSLIKIHLQDPKRVGGTATQQDQSKSRASVSAGTSALTATNSSISAGRGSCSQPSRR